MNTKESVDHKKQLNEKEKNIEELKILLAKNKAKTCKEYTEKRACEIEEIYLNSMNGLEMCCSKMEASLLEKLKLYEEKVTELKEKITQFDQFKVENINLRDKFEQTQKDLFKKAKDNMMLNEKVKALQNEINELKQSNDFNEQQNNEKKESEEKIEKLMVDNEILSNENIKLVSNMQKFRELFEISINCMNDNQNILNEKINSKITAMESALESLASKIIFIANGKATAEEENKIMIRENAKLISVIQKLNKLIELYSQRIDKEKNKLNEIFKSKLLKLDNCFKSILKVFAGIEKNKAAYEDQSNKNLMLTANIQKLRKTIESYCNYIYDKQNEINEEINNKLFNFEIFFKKITEAKNKIGKNKAASEKTNENILNENTKIKSKMEDLKKLFDISTAELINGHNSLIAGVGCKLLNLECCLGKFVKAKNSIENSKASTEQENKNIIRKNQKVRELMQKMRGIFELSSMNIIKEQNSLIEGIGNKLLNLECSLNKFVKVKINIENSKAVVEQANKNMMQNNLNVRNTLQITRDILDLSHKDVIKKHNSLFEGIGDKLKGLETSLNRFIKAKTIIENSKTTTEQINKNIIKENTKLKSINEGIKSFIELYAKINEKEQHSLIERFETKLLSLETGLNKLKQTIFTITSYTGKANKNLEMKLQETISENNWLSEGIKELKSINKQNNSSSLLQIRNIKEKMNVIAKENEDVKLFINNSFGEIAQKMNTVVLKKINVFNQENTEQTKHIKTKLVEFMNHISSVNYSNVYGKQIEEILNKINLYQKISKEKGN